MKFCHSKIVKIGNKLSKFLQRWWAVLENIVLNNSVVGKDKTLFLAG